MNGFFNMSELLYAVIINTNSRVGEFIDELLPSIDLFPTSKECLYIQVWLYAYWCACTSGVYFCIVWYFSNIRELAIWLYMYVSVGNLTAGDVDWRIVIDLFHFIARTQPAAQSLSFLSLCQIPGSSIPKRTVLCVVNIWDDNDNDIVFIYYTTKNRWQQKTISEIKQYIYQIIRLPLIFLG